MLRFLQSLAVLILASGFLGPPHADVARGQFEFTSENCKYKFAMTSRSDTHTGDAERWSLIDVSSGEVQYTMTGRFADKIIIVGPHGRSLAALDYFSYGSVNSSRALITLYQDTVILSRFSLEDLAIASALTMNTTSHFMWYLEAVIETPLITSGHRFTLTSFDLRSFTFDLQSGKLVSVAPDARLQSDTVLVSGIAHGVSPNFTMEINCVLSGDISSAQQLQFSLTPQQVSHGVIRGTRNRIYAPVDGYPFTAMRRNGKLLDAWEHYANNCTRPDQASLFQ